MSEAESNPLRIPYHSMPRTKDKYTPVNPIAKEHRDNGSVITVFDIKDHEGKDGIFIKIEKPTTHESLGNVISELKFALTMDGAKALHELMGKKIY